MEDDVRSSRTNRDRRELVSRRTAESGFLKRRAKGVGAGLAARARNNTAAGLPAALFDEDVAGDDVAMEATRSIEVGQRRIDEVRVRVPFAQKWWIAVLVTSRAAQWAIWGLRGWMSYRDRRIGTAKA